MQNEVRGVKSKCLKLSTFILLSLLFIPGVYASSDNSVEVSVSSAHQVKPDGVLTLWITVSNSLTENISVHLNSIEFENTFKIRIGEAQYAASKEVITIDEELKPVGIAKREREQLKNKFYSLSKEKNITIEDIKDNAERDKQLREIIGQGVEVRRIDITVPKDIPEGQSFTIPIKVTFSKGNSSSYAAQSIEQQVNFTVTSNPRPKRAIIVIVDGARKDKTYQVANNKPAGNITWMINNGVKVENPVDAFPSITVVNHPSILTGAYPRTHGIVGAGVWDKGTNEYTDYYSKIENFIFDVINNDLQVPTIYEALPAEKISRVFTEFVERGSDSSDTSWSAYANIEACKISPWARDYFCKAADTDVMDDILDNRIRDNRNFDLMVIWFPGNDVFSHLEGPDATDVTLNNIDDQIGRLREFLGQAIVDETVFVLTSDHGQTLVNLGRNIPPDQLADVLEAKGYYRNALGIDSHHDYYIGGNGGGSEEIYIQSNLTLNDSSSLDGTWSAQPRDIDVFPAAEAFKNQLYVDMVLVKYQGSNGYRVYTGGNTTQSLSTYFSGKENQYPDAIERINNLDSSLSGDIVLLAKYSGGYYFSTDANIGEHGNLNWEDSYVPLIVSGPGIKKGYTLPSAHIVDIAPTIVNLLLGIEMSGVDGRVLEEIRLPPPDTAPPTITNVYHSPSSPTSTDSINIYADITDTSGVSSATLFYSTDGSIWHPITMTNVYGNTWKTNESIPAQPAGTTLRYTVCASDAKGNSGCESGAYCKISGTTQLSSGEIIAQANCDIAVHTVTIGYADTAPPSIYNTYASPSSPSAYQSIEIYSEIKDDSSIASALVWYTTNGIDWNKIAMTNIGGNTFKTVSPIPGQPAGTEIDYTVCAKDVNGNAACEAGVYCVVSQSLREETVKLLNTTVVSAQSVSLTKITLDVSSSEVEAQYCDAGVHKITVGCTDTSPPGTPTLYDPGGTINEGEYSISWSSVSDVGCSGLKYYQLQESTSPSFSTTNYYTSLTSYYITGKSSGTYYYRVKAIDNANNAGGWSNTVDMTVDIPPPPTPAPPAPSWAAIDSFDDESGYAFSNGNSWGDWKYEELLDDGIDNYVTQLSSFEGRVRVGNKIKGGVA
ncbi:MAG: alkaline phosphatase family protein [Methanobacteriota archaeon]